MHSFTLLYTNDMHNRLTPAGAEQIAALKTEAPNTLLLDAGDALRAGNLGVTPWGESVLDLMNDAGYDLMTAGNRETHLWRWAVRAKVNRAAFPVLSANMTGPGVHAGQCEAVVPEALGAYVDRDILYRRFVVVRLPNGVRVGVLGLTVPMVTETMGARHISQFTFQDPAQTARALVPVLSGQADVIVALTHVGLAADRALAESVPGIHLIIGGHSHDTLAEPEVVNGVPILHAGSYARWVGRAEVGLEDGRVSVRSTLIALPAPAGGP